MVRNYIIAITQLAQTTLRSVIGRMELDKTLKSAMKLTVVVNVLDEAAYNWGVKVLRYEIKDLIPPHEILRSMVAQITAEREKRARIAESAVVRLNRLIWQAVSVKRKFSNQKGSTSGD